MGSMSLIEGARWTGTLESLGKLGGFCGVEGQPGCLVGSEQGGEQRRSQWGQGGQRVQGSAALEKGWGVIPGSAGSDRKPLSMGVTGSELHFRKASSGCQVVNEQD